MPRTSWVQFFVLAYALSSFTRVQAQASGSQIPSSWPHVYPGMPKGDYNSEWQNYFRVKEDLPNVTWPLPRNWAGNIPVQRKGHPNNTLFFWAFESEQGSFTANSSAPWVIWLNGGPGASSLLGLLYENGPIHVASDDSESLFKNEYAWSTIVDCVYMDQPVGTGFSTVGGNGQVRDEDQLGADFMGFLENFVKVFPNLATRPLYLTGESYAGVYIPYIMKTYFGMAKPPVNLTKIAIGDGAMGSYEESVELPVVSVLRTYSQIIAYRPQVFEYFQEQSALCGYNLTLQYPQPGHFPSLDAPLPPESSSASSNQYEARFTKRGLVLDIESRRAVRLSKRDPSLLEPSERLIARDTWERDLAGRPNGTIDPYYLCDLWTEMTDYAINFTYPWSSGKTFDPYNIPDALSPEAPINGSNFLNNAQTRAAIHAPTSKDWAPFADSTFLPTNCTTNPFGDPSVEPMAFMTDLATNATARNVTIVFYSGNDDALIPHYGTQIVIQNTTFGGIQGFTHKPETVWYDDEGEPAGIVHQERGWTYVLLNRTGHLSGYTNPAVALAFAREFIIGDNSLGLVNDLEVIGGEAPSRGNEIIAGQAAIYYGQATTASSYVFPSATVEAWNNYIATATAGSI